MKKHSGLTFVNKFSPMQKPGATILATGDRRL